MTDLRTKIAFSMLRGLHSELARQLLSRIGDEERFFEMSRDALRVIGHLPDRMIDDNERERIKNDAATEHRFVMSNQIEIQYFLDDNYPTRLIDCQDGPTLLYKLGKANLEARHVVGIVGTRHATPYGIDTTTRIVRELSERLDDLVVVSGLAYGIDVAAHKASLACNVPTVAVSAHPLNTIYPADHRGVAVKMLEAGGALVSEYPTTSTVHRGNFLERNRIVAGLSDVLIVVESDVKGGAMVTARLASDYNREVYAVPGRVNDRYSRGCNAMIASSRAHIFTDVDELIETMGWEAKQQPGQQTEMSFTLSPDEQAVIDFLVANPGSKQPEIMMATGIPTARLKDLLFNMEMEDKVMSMAGGKYAAIAN